MAWDAEDAWVRIRDRPKTALIEEHDRGGGCNHFGQAGYVEQRIDGWLGSVVFIGKTA